MRDPSECASCCRMCWLDEGYFLEIVIHIYYSHLVSAINNWGGATTVIPIPFIIFSSVEPLILSTWAHLQIGWPVSKNSHKPNGQTETEPTTILRKTGFPIRHLWSTPYSWTHAWEMVLFCHLFLEDQCCRNWTRNWTPAYEKSHIVEKVEFHTKLTGWWL